MAKSHMSEPRIETWFPKTIFVRDNVCPEILNNLEESVKSLSETKRTGSFNVDSSHLTNRMMQKEKYFDELSESILNNNKIYLTNLGYCEDFISDCFIGNMWYNVSNKGDYLFPHSHPGCIVAGAFYVKTVEENNIIFYDTINPSFEPPKYDNPLNWATAKYSCIPGRLLLFRGDMIHGTPCQNTDGEKIVISFNIVKSIEKF